MFDRLPPSRRPADDDAIDRRRVAEPVVQAPIVLRTEAVPALHLLHLRPAVPLQLDTRADRASIADRAFEGEFDPVPAWLNGVLIDEQRSALVRDEDVEDAAVGQIGKGDRAAIPRIGDADYLRDVGEPAEAVVQPDALALIAGQAAAFHRRPVG